VVPLKLDVTRPDQCEAAARAAGDVNVLINNAGLSHFGLTLLDDNVADVLRDEMDVNLFGILNTYRAFRDVLGRNGGGAIMNILSAAALMNVPLLATYSITKAAALSLTQGIRAVTTAQKTLVSAAIVGSVDTRMAKDVPGEVQKATPAFVAGAVLDGIERNEEEIDTDIMAVDVRARLARDPKKLERFMARGLHMLRKA
jgi:short-subunit dehydrogenase